MIKTIYVPIVRNNTPIETIILIVIIVLVLILCFICYFCFCIGTQQDYTTDKTVEMASIENTIDKVKVKWSVKKELAESEMETDRDYRSPLP